MGPPKLVNPSRRKARKTAVADTRSTGVVTGLDRTSSGNGLLLISVYDIDIRGSIGICQFLSGLNSDALFETVDGIRVAAETGRRGQRSLPVDSQLY
jgi:hypothetical protein